MRSYKLFALACACLFSACANNAATDLSLRGRPPTSAADGGADGNTGGTQGGAGQSGATGADANGSSSGTSTAGGNMDGGGSSAGEPEEDAGVVPIATGIIISEVMARPSSGSDNEWIEIWNGGSDSVDLDGCALATGDDASDEILIDGTLSLAQGAYLLFGRDGVEAESGVKPDYVYDGLYLSPEETITLSCAGQILSQVRYMGAESGASLQLDARYVTLGKTDVEAAWCDGTDALPLSSNKGTPKAGNRDCANAPAP